MQIKDHMYMYIVTENCFMLQLMLNLIHQSRNLLS